MSLFSLRGDGSGPATPAGRPFSRLTVRLPRSIAEARVVALHAGYGEDVKAGATVMTLRVGDVRRTVDAPRDGKVLPLAGPGDELVAGDALYALHLEQPIEPAAAEALSEQTAGTPGAAPTAPRRRVPVLRRDGTSADHAPGAAQEDAAARGRTEREEGATGLSGAGIAGGIARLILALGLFAAGVVLLLPLLIELGFGSSEEARLAVTIAALALGLLIWRLLAAGAGRATAVAIGAIGAAWAALVLLALIGLNPLPIGPMALSDTHALAPANRTRVPPARPAVAPPNPFSGVRAESGAGAGPPGGAEPGERVRFSAIPTDRFALPPPPEAPPAVGAGRNTAPPAAPAADAAPAAPSAAAAPPAADTAPPRSVTPAEPPARFGRSADEMQAAAPAAPAPGRAAGSEAHAAPSAGTAPAAAQQPGRPPATAGPAPAPAPPAAPPGRFERTAEEMQAAAPAAPVPDRTLRIGAPDGPAAGTAPAAAAPGAPPAAHAAPAAPGATAATTAAAARAAEPPLPPVPRHSAAAPSTSPAPSGPDADAPPARPAPAALPGPPAAGSLAEPAPAPAAPPETRPVRLFEAPSGRSPVR